MLVALESAGLPALSEIEDPADWRRYGVLAPRRDRRGRIDAFAEQWDPREDFKPPKHAAGWGWDDEIGEDKGGVWCTRHPEALLAEDPEVAELLTEFFSVTDRDVTRDDLEKRSAWWVMGWLTAVAAAQREERRRMDAEAERRRRRTKDQPAESGRRARKGG